jgi:hypothetical protein
MRRRYLYLLKDQSKVKVEKRAYRPEDLNIVWFTTLAAAFASFFYFFGEILWRALMGG